MKFLFLLLLVLLAAWLWRSARRDTGGPDRPSSPPPAAPQEMVRCTLCGTHLPHSEAVVGRTGIYCCAEHRQTAEP